MNKRKSNFGNLHSIVTSIKTTKKPHKFDILFEIKIKVTKIWRTG